MKERYLQCSKEECDLLITLALKGDLENRFPLYIWTLYYVIFIGIAFAYMTMYYVRLGKTNITFMIGRIIISYSLPPSDLFHNLKKNNIFSGLLKMLLYLQPYYLCFTR